MSVLSIEHLAPDHLLGIWRLEETSEQDFEGIMSPKLQARVADQKNVKRRLETLASHALLYSMLSRKDFVVEHEPSGQPLMIEGWHVSLSHTRGFVAAELSRTERVGLDVEYESDRVRRVQDKFLRNDEQAETLHDLLLFWCAKEAGYKYFSDQHLAFEEMKVEKQEELLRLTNLRQGTSIRLAWRNLPEAVLVYSL